MKENPKPPFDPLVIARSSPAAFAMHTTEGRWKPFDHLLLLDAMLLRACFGESRRTMVFMPPRHGKSRLISEHLPPFFLGRFPDRKVILTSYEADFAASWGGKGRSIINEYGPKLFNVRVKDSSRAADRWEIDGREGGMNTAGVGGPVTGKGADLLIIDDPVKNAEEANSPTMREKVWDWWLSTASTRLSKNGVVVLIMTRWHEDDLAGRLLKDMREGGEKWNVLRLPAIAEEDEDFGVWKRKAGQPLCPQLFPLDRLEEIRRRLGGYWWAALYQQRPAPMEGGIFKREWLRYYTQPEPGILDFAGRRVRVADLMRYTVSDLATSTKTTADYTVNGCFGLLRAGENSNIFLLDRYRGRIEGPDIIPRIREMLARWNASFAAVESTGFQLSLVQAARRDRLPVREISTIDPASGLYADRDKVSRAIAATPLMEQGRFWIPKDAAWLPEYESELLTFPQGENDDQVDVTTFGIHVGNYFSKMAPQPEGGVRIPTEAWDYADERADAGEDPAPTFDEWRLP